MPDAVNDNLVSETVIDAEFVDLEPRTEAADAAPAAPLPGPVPAIGPQRSRAAASYRNLTTITAISFSLTFVGVSVALLTGVLPSRLAALQLPVDMPVDMGVVLLMVPLCALVLAMLVEVLRMALRGVPRAGRTRRFDVLSTPRPAPAGWHTAPRQG